MSESIIAAACRYQGLTFWRDPPTRHGDIISEIVRLLHPKKSELPICPPDDQGFMTSDKRFVGRAEAKRIAIAAGQSMLRDDHKNHEDLFSEDLW